MPDLADGASVEVQGSGTNKYTLKNVGGVYSCSCPAWRNAGGGIEKRTCKHLKAYRGEDKELARIGGPPPPKPKPQPKNAGVAAATTAKADGPPLLLAHTWETAIDPAGWWMSEKLDGVRAYWDGKQMISRLGNMFHVPDWFLEKLPDTPLDGELFGGRKKFQQTVGLVKRQDKSDHWKELRYVVFDAPSMNAPFEERIEFVKGHISKHSPPYATAHDHEKCKGADHLKKELARIEALGGEGVMLRKPGSKYEIGRSSTLLKVKSFFDAEAKVIGHEEGKGKHKGRCGSLLVEMPNGTHFSVGTGMSDEDRKNPPAVGTIITYRYQELSNTGVPRFPSYVGVRDDVAWKEEPNEDVPAWKKGPAAALLAGSPIAEAAPTEPSEAAGTPGTAGNVKAWKFGAPGEPSFPATFDVTRKAVLQVTDIKTNRNKYYCIELHTAGTAFRVFTHYGRTDDLETNPNAGAKECRYFLSLADADAEYNAIYREKTSNKKGYKEVSLASAKIGSQQTRGQSVGQVDAKTLEKLAEKDKGKGGPKPGAKVSNLPPTLQDLIHYIYEEATGALTKTINAKITANGIETPLGVLTIGQVEKGEKILETAYDVFKAKKKNMDSELERLSGEFYSAIPHRIGRTRTAIQGAIINSLEQFEQKQETLQLMKDMLSVNGDAGENVLLDPEVDKKYAALNCDLTVVEKDSSTFREMEAYVLESQVKHKRIKVQRMFSVKRASEWKSFTDSISNQRMLFHGSRIKNWVGILSRGLLTPKIVVSMGVNRTDAGWLGSGIYFGDAACTSAFYTTPGSKGTRLMAIHRVALGKMKGYTKISYGISAPPAGFDSCHGVRNGKGASSQFEDDEYVIYDGKQQRQELLVEFTV